jgi:hypothetical protein
MPRYQFIGGPPRSFKIVFVLAFINFCTWAIVGGFRQHWALRSPEGAFTYPIRFKGEGLWYFRPVVGAYITWSFFAHFAAMALLALILYRNRHLLRPVPKE